MKITITYQYFGTHDTLWSTRWTDFSRHLAEEHDLTIITSNFIRSDIQDVRLIKIWYWNEIRIIQLGFGDGNNFSLLRRMLNATLFALFSSIIQLLVKSDIYIFSSGPFSALIGSLFCKKRKTIIEIRDLWPEGGLEMKKIPKILAPILYFLQRKIYIGAKKIVTCSPAQKDYIKCKYPNLNVCTIEHGLDDQLKSYKKYLDSNYSIPSNKIERWVVCATLGYIHDPIKWVCLAENLKTSNIQIILIGDGPLKNHVLSEIEKRELTNIHVMGQISKKEISKEIFNATMCLFTTLDNIVQNTSAPNKIYDYIIFKKPILTDLNNWLLKEYKEIILNVDFNNLQIEEILEWRKNINIDAFDQYARKLNRKELSKIYLNDCTKD